LIVGSLDNLAPQYSPAPISCTLRWDTTACAAFLKKAARSLSTQQTPQGIRGLCSNEGGGSGAAHLPTPIPAQVSIDWQKNSPLILLLLGAATYRTPLLSKTEQSLAESAALSAHSALSAHIVFCVAEAQGWAWPHELANGTNLDRKFRVGRGIRWHFTPPQSDLCVRRSQDGKERAW
jgi:hypothetical protein